MKVDYATHYDAAYWQQRKEFRDAEGNLHRYGGPSLAWEGFDYVADAMKTILNPGTLLDIGCSGGDLMQRLEKRGFDVYGVDISKHALSAVPKHLKPRTRFLDITTCPARIEGFPKSFTNVISTDLMEHIYESDLDDTFAWIKDQCDGVMFLLIAVTTGEEFVHTKGAEVPLRWEGTAIAGHVNVRRPGYWVRFFQRHGMRIDWNRMYLFQMQREKIKSWQATAGWDHAYTWVVKK